MKYKIFKSSYLSQNTTLLYQDQSAVLIDPGVLPVEMEEIRQFLQQYRLELEAVLFTHTHGDHFAGWKFLPESSYYAGSGYQKKSVERREKDILFIENIYRSNHIDVDEVIEFPAPIQLVENGEIIETGPFRFSFFHTPGHAIDQAMIVSHELQMAFSGDMLIKSPYPFILESVLQYRMSLGYMMRIVDDHEVRVCVPGHYKEAEGAEVKKRIKDEMGYIDSLYAFLFNHYNPSMSQRELEESLLHMDINRVNVHFTHKMNVNRLISEIHHLL